MAMDVDATQAGDANNPSASVVSIVKCLQRLVGRM